MFCSVCVYVSLSVTGFCLHMMNIIILLLQTHWTNNVDMVTQNVYEALTVVAMNSIIFYLMRCSSVGIRRRFGGRVYLQL